MRTYAEREREVEADVDDLLSETRSRQEAREALTTYLMALMWRLDDYAALVALMPPCPHRSHGPECLAHAWEWVCQQRAKEVGVWDAGEAGR